MFSSGQKAASAVIIAEACFYGGSILIGATSVATLQIHNCKALAGVTAANMVGEISVTAVAGDCKVDPVPKGISCPKGLVAILDGTAKYHVRGNPGPY